MTDNDLSEWRLFDTNLTTQLGLLPAANAHFYFILNETGSGGLSIPLSSASAAQITSGMYAQFYYRGAARGGFFIENIRKDNAVTGEGGDQWMTISGRGAMALLDDAVIWTNGTTETKRDFTAKTKAYVLKTLIDEAQARGGLSVLTYDFTAILDSDGVAWTDSEDYSFAVGVSLLDVVRQFAVTGIDFEMVYSAGSFVLSAYKNGIGTDKSSTIYMRVGSNCEEVTQDERGNDIKNAYIVPYKNGSVLATDATSITAYRRREKMLDARVAQSAASASTYGAAVLSDTKDPQQGKVVKVYDGVNPRAFVDYIVGDYVKLDIQGVESSYRVLGLQCDVSGEHFSNVTLELNSLLLSRNLKREQDLNNLLKQWNTARDADLLEVSYWAQIGAADNDGQVNALLTIGDNIYVGGSFTRMGGISANNFAIYNTVTGAWTTIASGIGTGGVDYVNAITLYGTDIYIGGSFTSPYNFITKTDGATFSSVGGGLSARVTSFAEAGGDLYIAGWFLSNFAATISMYRVARWDGAAYSPLAGSGSGAQDPVDCLASIGDILYVGGDIAGYRTSVPVNVASWGLFTFDTSTNGFGAVTHAVGTGVGSYDNIGDPTDGTHDDNFFHGPRAMVADGTDLYVGGEFINVGGIDSFGQYIGGGLSANYIAKWDTAADEWSALENGLDFDVYALANDNGIIYVGGGFLNANNVSASGIARYSGGLWLALGAGVSGTVNVYALSMHNTDVYVGGAFTVAGGQVSKYFSAYITDFQSMLESLSNSSSSNFDIGAAIHNAVAITAATDADEFGLWEDSSTAFRKITWANIKATLVTYFNTLYLSLTQTANRIIFSNAGGVVGVNDALQYSIASRELKLTGSGDYARIAGVSDGDSAGMWIVGGDGVNAGNSGGYVEIDGGAGNTIGEGGGVDIYGGEGGASGNGGYIGLWGGFGGATTGTAGNIDIFAGGINDGNGNGGNVTIGAGDGAGAGVNGQVIIQRAKFTDTPAIQYTDTKANIEALVTASEGAIAYATDTNEIGTYSGVAWTWGQGVNGSGTAGRAAEWVDADTIQAANLIAPANLLTLIAGGAYSLTIPATGTAALLGTANVFTRIQFVDGSANEIIARLQQHSTHTVDSLTIENSSASVLGGFDRYGRVMSYINPAKTENFFTAGAGNASVTGQPNTGIGTGALASNISGANNVGIGSYSLTNATGSSSLGIGTNSLSRQTSGADCIGIGATAGFYNQSGTKNTWIGTSAGLGVVSNSNSRNVGIGYFSGTGITTGNNNLFLGAYSGQGATASASSIFIGFAAGANQTTTSQLFIVDNAGGSNSPRASAAVEATNSIIYGVMASTPAAQSLALNAVVKTGGRKQTVAVKSADYTAAVNDEVIVFTATATLTLPAATGSGQTYRVCNEGVGATVTIDGNASETIKRELTQTLAEGEDIILNDYATGKWV